ncbi:MAG: ThiF family adenylyltransferase [Bryobacterales bacterium]|nr:ThiF family adenylyltransferase [Bryobacterales bacterium]
MQPPAPIRISPAQMADDRFSRFRLIDWWDQERIASARVLVVGAGALGNEILKNLALLGFRRILVVDLDRIELSNLSRGVLFRESDIGRKKAEAAAAAVRSLYPQANVVGLRANVMQQLGLGVFDWADVILGGLDNREARLFLNRSAWKMGKPWVDGAIEGVNGVVRVFESGRPACYECTLGAVDWAILERRMSCNLLTRADEEQGKVATTPTTSSVIAGIQVQEALKLLHGLPTLSGKGYVFEGLRHTSYVTEYTPDPDCQSHYVFDRVVRLKERSDTLTAEALCRLASRELRSEEVTIEFSRDIIWKLVHPETGAVEERFAPLGGVSYEEGRDPSDGVLREVVTRHGFTLRELAASPALAGRLLSDWGLPLYDAFVARSPESEVAFVMAGDAPQVLQSLAGEEP